jgi:CubicO group peptidase (beta-lactamase class C family)
MPTAARAFLLTLAVAIPGPIAADQEPSFQVLLDSARASLGIPGAAAAVIFADGTTWEGASGLAGPGTPVSPSTAFELGSISKVYTATTVLKLVAEGRLDLECRLRRWLPDLPGSGSITLAQLLNHTHGLHDPLQEPDFVPAVLGSLPGRGHSTTCSDAWGLRASSPAPSGATPTPDTISWARSSRR